MTDAEKLAAIAAAIDDRVWIPTDVIQAILTTSPATDAPSAG